MANTNGLKNWDDVNLTLKEVAEDKMQIKKITVDSDIKISDMKLEAEMQIKPLQENIKKLEKEIEEFTESNKADIKGKSKKLIFGEIGFRKSTKVVIEDSQNTLEHLKNFKMTDCISTKESINKTALKKYSPEALKNVGANIKVDESFFYKTN